MILAFYAIDNARRFGRNSFNASEPKEILDKLMTLPAEEVRFYDTERLRSFERPALDAFVEDYNNEELDAGWWCVLIPED